MPKHDATLSKDNGTRSVPANVAGHRPQQDPLIVRWLLTLLALAVIGALVIVPVVNVFYEALATGVGVYWKTLVTDADTRHAILLTLAIVPLSVVANTVFGVAAAWCIARFRFPGRTVLTTLIDLPFSVSPVVAGLSLVLIFGSRGYLGPLLNEFHFKIIFAVPGMLLATSFVTLPFVARELIPVMEAQGSDEELAAISLGASGWQMFWRVTLPNIKWGLLYGIILCNARAMGEFGAVYVVSGRIIGQTLTVPLQIEMLFQDSKSPQSFALASVLTALALVTLVIKVLIERKSRLDLAEAAGTRQEGDLA